MSVYSDRIKPNDCHIRTYLDDLVHKAYQIPTFQREVVWTRDSVKHLWDSIYRFYPIGSILVWKTTLRLHNHRTIGGHVISDENGRDGYQYILDGQQRTTSLLTSLYGGRIDGYDDFDPTLYFDLTVEDQDEIDDESYKSRFLFWDEIDDRDGVYRRNTPRRIKYENGLIIKLIDVMERFGDVERHMVDNGHGDYDDPIRQRLRGIRDVLDNYRLSLIELKGIEVSEVCQIFERINQAGKPLDIFDIVVAKTFRVSDRSRPGFYLRELVEGFRDSVQGNYGAIDDETYLQIIAVIIQQNIPDSQVANITPSYLNRIQTEHIEAVWPGTERALRRMFDFLDNHLHIKGPRLIPYRYLYMSLASHFYENARPNYAFLKRYFWFHVFHNEDLLTNTTHLRRHVDLLREARAQEPNLGLFLINKHQLRTASYSTRGRLASAILCLLANQEPRDWAEPDRHVLNDVYYALTDRPNLHHVFPIDYLDKHPGANTLDANSMMNIAYLSQLTNLEISNRNPIHYMLEYDRDPRFEMALKTHFIPSDLLDWARRESMPENALDSFIEGRIDLMIDDLRTKLQGVPFDLLDTRHSPEP